ncbi:hybrid sensor histidine kinase/response regulator [Ramlibacter sp. AN1015]|uniref:hybrid sensor histidine kinase/response regulator n=1 Tax=Ramlibacter sp. AN1015 TaxID=3133428 RepID=UPI0030C29E47
MLVEARGILFVDDEAISRKWFVRSFGKEFQVATAASADEALQVLAERGHEFAVVFTDYRMPEQDGLQLLTRIQTQWRHLVRLLATAYAEKDVAIAAVNQGRVLRILEKPLEDEPTRETLREALEAYRMSALQRAQNESRAVAVRETLGFLAHELNTPLATIRGSITAVLERRCDPSAPGVAQFDDRAGDILASLQRIERRAQYCQSLVATFVQSARDAFPDAAPQSFSASGLLAALMAEYPFEADERAAVQVRVLQDFRLPGRRDLVYVVVCTLVKNALQALRGHDAPLLRLEVGCTVSAAEAAQGWIRITDNGPGIAADILARLTREPVTTRASSGGSGMGLMFCQRVMQDARGSVEVASVEGAGTTVTLRMPASSPA